MKLSEIQRIYQKAYEHGHSSTNILKDYERIESYCINQSTNTDSYPRIEKQPIRVPYRYTK